MYYRPNAKNFGAIDSFLVHDCVLYLFQMTMNSKHSVDSNELNKALDSIFSCYPLEDIKMIQLCFIVPDVLFESYSFQPFIEPSSGPKSMYKDKLTQSVIKVTLSKYKKFINKHKLFFEQFVFAF